MVMSRKRFKPEEIVNKLREAVTFTRFLDPPPELDCWVDVRMTWGVLRLDGAFQSLRLLCIGIGVR